MQTIALLDENNNFIGLAYVEEPIKSGTWIIQCPDLDYDELGAVCFYGATRYVKVSNAKKYSDNKTAYYADSYRLKKVGDCQAFVPA